MRFLTYVFGLGSSLMLVMLAVGTQATSSTYRPTAIPFQTSAPLPLETLVFTPVDYNEAWQPIVHDFDGVSMVLVPSGCFMMGSDSGDADEQPAHQQCFALPFWIDEYEVTNGQFESWGGVASQESDYSHLSGQPRIHLTWLEATAFCNLRGVRLPTEAEWEYAARGPSNYSYPWGDAFWSWFVAVLEPGVGIANWGGYRGRSWVGARDLSGSVWEWTSSIYQPYPYMTNDGREDGSNVQVARVVRGGSVANDAADLRASERYSDVPDHWADWGFRCARDYASKDGQ